VRASLEVNDALGASDALRKILDWYPDSFYSDRSMLLVGQRFTLADRPAEARTVFAEFARRFPQSPLSPEVDLAVARSFVQERDWPSAIGAYEQWLERFPTNAMRARAEFNRAWAHWQAGQVTNALALFTNFLARFPAHDLAPRAQEWAASFYYNQGDFVNAELHYQRLFQNTNWPTTLLTYQARMMAGRCAVARQSYNEAYDYFTRLVEVLFGDTNAPPDLLPEALFALADTLTEGARFDRTKPLESRFGEAIKVFNRIIRDYPTNRLATLAWGRVGDCHFQLARQDAQRYLSASNAYVKVLESPLADTPARGRAEFALGKVLERLAEAKGPPDNAELLDAAFDHYYNVVCGKNLPEGQQPDPVWLKEAGLAAAALAEERGRWEVAVNLYNRLGESLPPLRPMLARKISRAREQTRTGAN
jgi:TolA-binding protein